MLLESTQILCTISNKLGSNSPYKTAHTNHPAVLWAGKTLENWQWLFDHAFAISDEYTARYNKIHACYDVLLWVENFGAKPKPSKLEPFVQCMPDIYKNRISAVAAYREYYRKEKSGFAKWKLGNKPVWMDIETQ